MEAGALAGMHVAVASPPGREPDHDVVIGSLQLAAEHGGSVRIGHDPRAAVDLADVVFTGEEVSAEVTDGPSLASEQEANRLPVAQAFTAPACHGPVGAMTAGEAGRRRVAARATRLRTD